VRRCTGSQRARPRTSAICIRADLTPWGPENGAFLPLAAGPQVSWGACDASTYPDAGAAPQAPWVAGLGGRPTPGPLGWLVAVPGHPSPGPPVTKVGER
jgi:hypothetical protein